MERSRSLPPSPEPSRDSMPTTLVRRVLHATPALICALALATVVVAQEGTSTPSRPNVFLDCQGPNCDDEYYRTEIDWVNWVRDPLVAHVHVIVTQQTTAAAGREYQLDFIGRAPFTAYQDRMLQRFL